MPIVPASLSGVFGFKLLRRTWELVPLTIALTTACVGGVSFMGFSLYHKPDVWVLKKTGTADSPPWEHRHPKDASNIKEFVTGSRPAAIIEIEELRREIGSWRAR